MTAYRQMKRPVLARGVRYRWDDIRDQHQLLYPEGLLVLNETGAAIVQLCDGRSLDEIVESLAEDFAVAEVPEDVHQFLGRLTERGLIRDDA